MSQICQYVLIFVILQHLVGAGKTDCQGLLVRCGDTSSQLFVSGLYLLWDMSSRIWSGIVAIPTCRYRRSKADEG
jgi:hypothetical protein